MIETERFILKPLTILLKNNFIKIGETEKLFNWKLKLTDKKVFKNMFKLVFKLNYTVLVSCFPLL